MNANSQGCNKRWSFHLIAERSVGDSLPRNLRVAQNQHWVTRHFLEWLLKADLEEIVPGAKVRVEHSQNGQTFSTKVHRQIPSESLYTIKVSWSSRTGVRPTLCSKVIPLAMSSASLGEPVRWYSTPERGFMLVAVKMDRKEAALICSHKIQHLSKTKQGILAIHGVP